MATAFQKFKPDAGDAQLDLLSNAAPHAAATSHHDIEIQGTTAAPTTTANGRDTTSNNATSSNHRGALSLLSSNPFKGIERYGMPFIKTITHYIINDLFTTLLNASALRFMLVFFAAYMALYFTWAIIYMMFPGYCMNMDRRDFGHSFWFSFSTASTIGYSGEMWPNPECNGFNFVVMLEIILASLVDYCLMGVVFARFAAPLPKARAIRFSANAVLYQPCQLSQPSQGPLQGSAQHQGSATAQHQGSMTSQGSAAASNASNLWVLSFRMANIRKHSLLKPEIQLLLALPDAESAMLRFKYLEVQDMTTQEANLRLGLPASVTHVVSPCSPLYDLSLEEMEARGAEIICFLDGMDPMTSAHMQARNSYRAADIRMNEQFTSIGLQANRHGMVGLDFTHFDRTVAVQRSSTSDDAMEGPAIHEPVAWLRTQTFHATSVVGHADSFSSGVRHQQPAVASLIDQVLADVSAGPALKRAAAVAKAEVQGSTLPPTSEPAVQSVLPVLPVSIAARNSFSEGGRGSQDVLLLQQQLTGLSMVRSNASAGGAAAAGPSAAAMAGMPPAAAAAAVDPAVQWLPPPYVYGGADTMMAPH